MTWAGGALILFFAVCAAGLPLSAFAGRRATAIIAWGGALGSLLLMVAAAARLAGGRDLDWRLWTIHDSGPLSLHMDALSAIFLFVAGMVYLPCSLFAADQLRHREEGHASGRVAERFGALHFALMAAVGLILAAGDALTFLLGWECMSILCYLLVNDEPAQQGDTGAGFVMLAMGEAGFLAVVVAFLIAGAHAQGFSFEALRTAGSSLPGPAIWGVFVLGFLGFGVKAGLVPVNSWLPRCYTASPPAFIPVLAGVTLNLGLYGIVRLNGDLAPGHGVGPGLLIMAMGSLTALVGILYATTENDLKAMLAHSSIENAGVIIAGFGAYLTFRNSGHPTAAALALTAALYHLANHSVYKALLYQGAGQMEAAAGTRDMDRLGGLIRRLPGLSVVFLVGCLAIAAVPPFNGFVSEWLTLQAFLRSAVLASALVKIVFALCGAALALTAALAVTCFVKTYAMSFLGIRRGEPDEQAAAAPTRRALAPLAILAVVCLLLGILPTYVIPVLDRAVQPLAGASATAALVPPFFTATPTNGQIPAAFLSDFHHLGAQAGSGWLPGRGLVLLLRGGTLNPVVFAMSPAYSLGALAIFLFLAWLVVGRLTRRRAVARREMWAGGIPRLLPEMTYTATGFSNPVRVVFQAIFRPNLEEDVRETVNVHFRTAIRRHRDETHPVERWFLRPIGDAATWIAHALAGMHHGRLNAYVSYFLGFLLFMLFLYRLA